MIIPIGMVILSLFIIFINYNAAAIPLSIELKGGTLITAYHVPRGIELEDALEDRFNIDFKVGVIREISGAELGRTIETNNYLEGAAKEGIRRFLVNWGVAPDDITIRSVGPSISARFLKEAIKAVLFAFMFMAIVVFIRFRTLVPSLAVVLSAFSDIITTLAVMILLGIELSPGTFVALLLLIGYSVDTDILLTTRLLVRKTGTFEERLYGAMKTGLTMNATTLAAVMVILLASTSRILKEIAVVILIGLLVDLLNTWIQNAGILHWYTTSGGRY
ncbi:MAG: protein translocase subunit SecF [Candidatus Hydrothermarchaeaceae archaeon]